MYRCEWCGAVFEQPAERVYRENMDGENGWYTWHMAVCPYCFEEGIDYVTNETPDTLEGG